MISIYDFSFVRPYIYAASSAARMSSMAMAANEFEDGGEVLSPRSRATSRQPPIPATGIGLATGRRAGGQQRRHAPDFSVDGKRRPFCVHRVGSAPREPMLRGKGGYRQGRVTFSTAIEAPSLQAYTLQVAPIGQATSALGKSTNHNSYSARTRERSHVDRGDLKSGAALAESARE